MIISTAHRAARNAATIALADMGAGPSSIKIYDENGVLLAVCRLAKPCGTITEQGRIALQQSSQPDLVLATGTPSRGEWCDGDGVPIWALQLPTHGALGRSRSRARLRVARSSSTRAAWSR